MEKYFVTYEQALDLRKLGFNELCTAWYNDKQKLVYCQLYSLKRNSEIDTKPGTYIGELGCYAPLKLQVFEWFRKEYNTNVCISWRDDLLNYDISLTEMKKGGYFYYKENFNNYEEAESTCIDRLIEIIKTK